MSDDKKIDESWKDSVNSDKDVLKEGSDDTCGCGSDHESDSQNQGAIEVSFINYVMSLGFQAMIFLGEVPNPVTNETEKNVNQAKFLIDTLVMIKEKTKGNLDEQEENFLSATVYDLQLKFIESQKSGASKPE